jgi:mono/diheme cytochrome c family protein
MSLAILSLSIGASLAPLRSGSLPPRDARALFQQHCAVCHGERGDGQGSAKLERPARSFQAGGFSYGNTPEALARTITFGIPGTPMPAFESTLAAAEREELAAYVLSLGPPIEPVDRDQTVLRVAATPLVVRGHLPPIAEGLPEHPRGLLIGRPEGVTFEYRADDVRLLGLRQGEFVERRDWTGRGGSALLPLGAVVELIEGGEPRALFRGSGGTEYAARLEGTWVAGDEAGVAYRLELEGVPKAHVREVPRPSGNSAGSGYRRAFRIVAVEDLELVVRLFAFGERRRIDSFSAGAGAAGGPATEWTVWRNPAGSHEVLGLALSPGGHSVAANNGLFDLHLRVPAGDEAAFELTRVLAHAWSDDVRARFAEEVAR